MRERGIGSFVVDRDCDRVGPGAVGSDASSGSAPRSPAQAPAQTPAQPPAQPAPAQPAKPPEPPHNFTGTLTVGISLESGQTDLNATQIMIQGQRPYSKDGTFTMKAGYTRATTRPPAEPGRDHRSPIASKANVGIEKNYRQARVS